MPLAQTAGVEVGPHTVKATVPPGTPAWVLPVTVAVSVTVPVGPMMSEPSPEDEADCWVAVWEGAGVTVKHRWPGPSPVTLSVEPG